MQNQVNSGRFPNASFRAVPFSHLADHPDFVALPDDTFMNEYSPKNYAELRLYSQDSSEWDFLHTNRLTTSRCAAFLGFYESKSADILSIPNGLRGHSKALHAVLHLREQGRKDTLSTHEKTTADILINRKREKISSETEASSSIPSSSSSDRNIKITHHTYLASIVGLQLVTSADICVQDLASYDAWKREGNPSRGLWRPSPNGDLFPSSYHPSRPSFEFFNDHSRNVRMAFGSEQESTAVLAALNVLVQRARVKEKENKEIQGVQKEEKKVVLIPSSVTIKKKKISNHASSTLSQVIPSTSNQTLLIPSTILEPLLIPLIPTSSISTSTSSSSFYSSYSSSSPTSTTTSYRPTPPRVLQIGLCPLEALSSQTDSYSSLLLPLIGASPDGVFINSDGTVSSIEVKCHSPFLEDSRGPARINDRGPQESIGAWHVPQLMLEVLCLGPFCIGTYFVSMSATRGCNIFFLKRDDKYISELLRIVSILYKKFVLNIDSNSEMPVLNFGHEIFKSKDDVDYIEFLHWTRRIALSAELVEAVPESKMQRSPYHNHFFFDTLLKTCKREGRKLFY